jgi:hypothetical protein
VRSYVVRESVWGEREGERVCAEEDEDRGRAIEYVQAIPVASQMPRSKVALRFGFFFCLSLLWIFLSNVRREC